MVHSAVGRRTHDGQRLQTDRNPEDAASPELGRVCTAMPNHTATADHDVGEEHGSSVVNHDIEREALASAADTDPPSVGLQPAIVDRELLEDIGVERVTIALVGPPKAHAIDLPRIVRAHPGVERDVHVRLAEVTLDLQHFGVKKAVDLVQLGDRRDALRQRDVDRDRRHAGEERDKEPHVRQTLADSETRARLRNGQRTSVALAHAA